MTIWQAAILGIIQGITEFLPISSSGHLIFLPRFFGWPDQGLDFDAVLHLGTLLAVVIYFRSQLKKMWRAWWSNQENGHQDRKLVWGLLVAVIPAAIVGFLLGGVFERLFRSPVAIAVSLAVFGVVLGLADWLGKKKYGVGRVGIFRALYIGLAQVLALIPGVSRSGITMTAGLTLGLKREAAAEFSFLLSIPIIILAATDGFWHWYQSNTGLISGYNLIIGLFFSFLSGILGIGLLMKILKKWSFWPFVLYRLLVAFLIIFFFA